MKAKISALILSVIILSIFTCGGGKKHTILEERPAGVQEHIDNLKDAHKKGAETVSVDKYRSCVAQLEQTDRDNRETKRNMVVMENTNDELREEIAASQKKAGQRDGLVWAFYVVCALCLGLFYLKFKAGIVTAGKKALSVFKWFT